MENGEGREGKRESGDKRQKTMDKFEIPCERGKTLQNSNLLTPTSSTFSMLSLQQREVAISFRPYRGWLEFLTATFLVAG